MKRLAFLLTLLIAGSLGAWHFYFSPDAVKKRAVVRTLADMDAAAATQDRARIAAFLEKALLPDANIELNVSMAGSVYAQAAAPMKETFSKPDFIRFIDLTLYSVNNYAMSAWLTSYLPQKDGSAKIILSTSAGANGDAYFNGLAIKSRFIVEGECSGTVMFAPAGTPQLHGSACQLGLRILPQPETQDFQHLKDTLERYKKP